MTSSRVALERVAAFGRSANPVARFRRGSGSLFNISIYTFGMSGVWTGYGSILLQFKATEIAAGDGVSMVGWTLDKTALAAFISLIGLGIAAVVQPLVGVLSDRQVGMVSLRRYPFIILGMLGLAVSTLMFGFVNSFLALLLVTVAMQVTGNTAQGPANALIIDHVDDRERGRASGYLNLMRLIGSGFVAMIVVFLMSNYDVEDAPQWLWYSVIVMVAVLLATTFYTLLALRVRPLVEPKGRPPLSDGHFPRERGKPCRPSPLDSRLRGNDGGIVEDWDRVRYYFFLLGMAILIAAMSATQTNAVFFVQDVIGLDNPARGGNYILLALVGSAGVVVYPAGKLSDHIGRGVLLLMSGVMGAVGVVSLLLLDADSLLKVIPGVIGIGISVGIYLSVAWAVANDLVRRSRAAGDLGLTSISGLIGAIAGRSSGFFIGGLNERGLDWGIDYLGYGVLLGSAGLAFLVSGVVFWLVVRGD
ncbi:MAG: MFS transporter [Chloroflexi bacterium]|nr:MFS transporter [Chloroflexota bacterium]